MMRILMQGGDMRTTVTIDDELLRLAREAAGDDRVSEVVRAALEAFVERDAARRLAKLGGTMPGASAAPRRRSEPA
jgi:Arc/MetJ family transcription regulator